MPVRRITSNAREGARAFIALTHSSRTRSLATLRNVSSVGRMAASVAGSSVELERRDEARRAEDAQPVLGEALLRIADGAEDALGQVAAPVERVDDLARRRGRRRSR